MKAENTKTVEHLKSELASFEKEMSAAKAEKDALNVARNDDEMKR